jgi:hypothetical protein
MSNITEETIPLIPQYGMKNESCRDHHLVVCFCSHSMYECTGLPETYRDKISRSRSLSNPDNSHDVLLEMRTKSASSLKIVSCDMCSHSGLELSASFFHCPICKFDLCSNCVLVPLSDLPKEKLISKIIELYESKNELLEIVKELKSALEVASESTESRSPSLQQLHLRNPSALLVEEMIASEQDIVAGEEYSN